VCENRPARPKNGSARERVGRPGAAAGRAISGHGNIWRDAFDRDTFALSALSLLKTDLARIPRVVCRGHGYREHGRFSHGPGVSGAAANEETGTRRSQDAPRYIKKRHVLRANTLYVYVRRSEFIKNPRRRGKTTIEIEMRRRGREVDTVDGRVVKDARRAREGTRVAET